jgi:RsiW-degrading membrane proteinase PrsW (M82 family)
MAQAFMLDPIKIIFTVLVSFIPSIIYAIIIRYSEKYEREPWGSIGQAFLWGGTLSIVLVILIRGFFDFHLQDHYARQASDLQWRTLVLMVVITPFAAELIKPIGLFLVKADILEAEDGLIYGAVIGLGYTATENLLFGIFLAPLFGLEMFITVVFMRSMSVMFVQSSATALSCYGITRAMKVKHKTGRMFAFPAFLLVAVAIHAAFNYIVFMDLFDIGDIIFSMSSSLIFSIVFAFILMFMIYSKIYRLDRIDEQEAKRKEMEEYRERQPERVGRRVMYPQERAPPSRQRPPPDDYRDYDYDPYDDYEREPYPPPGAPHARRPPARRTMQRPPARAQSRVQPPPMDFPGIYEPPTRRSMPPPSQRPPYSQAPPRPPRSTMQTAAPPPSAPRPPRQHIQAPPPPSNSKPPRPPRSLTSIHEPEPELKKPGEKTTLTSEPPLRPTQVEKKAKTPAEPVPVEVEEELDEEEENEEVEDEDTEDAEVDWEM